MSSNSFGVNLKKRDEGTAEKRRENSSKQEIVLKKREHLRAGEKESGNSVKQEIVS